MVDCCEGPLPGTVLGWGDGLLVGRTYEVGLQSESHGSGGDSENSKQPETGEPGLVFPSEVQPLPRSSLSCQLRALRPRLSLLAIPTLHIEPESEGVAPETPPGMTTAM